MNNERNTLAFADNLIFVGAIAAIAVVEEGELVVLASDFPVLVGGRGLALAQDGIDVMFRALALVITTFEGVVDGGTPT